MFDSWITWTIIKPAILPLRCLQEEKIQIRAINAAPLFFSIKPDADPNYALSKQHIMNIIWDLSIMNKHAVVQYLAGGPILNESIIGS